MKEIFEKAEIAFYSFEHSDIITTSQPSQDLIPEDEF